MQTEELKKAAYRKMTKEHEEEDRQAEIEAVNKEEK